jgi:hypothetical protein
MLCEKEAGEGAKIEVVRSGVTVTGETVVAWIRVIRAKSEYECMTSLHIIDITL